MTRNEMLLTVLAEECVETAQRVSKAIRFGLTEIQPGQPFTNAERIIYEFNDIVALMDILVMEGALLKTLDGGAIAQKIRKVQKYLDYSETCGTIED